MPPRNVEKQTSTALTIAVSSRLTDGFGFNYALSDETLAKYPALLSTGKAPDWSVSKAWQDGLFLLGGAHVPIAARNQGRDPITISSVRLVNIVEECMPLGLAYKLGNEGGGSSDEDINLRFNIDADSPIAYEHDRGADPAQIPPNVPYFSGKTVTIAPGESKVINVMVGSLRRPHSFTIAIDTTVGGQQGVQLISNAGVPFRFAPSLCPSATQRTQMKPEDIAWMKNQQFKNVRVRVGIATMGESDPAKYSGPCNAI
ncbi:hypothetical protein Rhe02_75170 [Rhizocola hellebori]|uniref:Uncharacterized protein n=1 Tax=Rhizocola hellebori TaxID=1392758 RepID=A0A8J3QEM8_9ACTN|nr:hypothetical protein Rhe02_75170 [Rhizocola hellebori]